MTPEELIRVVRMLAGEEDEPQRETTEAHLRTGGGAGEARHVVNASMVGVRQPRGPRGVRALARGSVGGCLTTRRDENIGSCFPTMQS